MSYAVKNDGSSWRAVNGEGDCLPDETYSIIEPAIPNVVVEVVSVTMRQARLALLSIGKLEAVSAAINALPEPKRTAANIEWDYAASVEKSSPLIQSLAPQIGITESDLTDLFNAAALL